MTSANRPTRVSFHRGPVATVASLLLILTSAPPGFAEPPLSANAIKEYSSAIAQAQADLDAGRTVEAKKRLDATEKSLRGFEYDYLVARSQAPGSGKGAPDLIRTIANPKTPSRYAVLNEVNKQLAFICQDGSLVIHDLGNPTAPPRTETQRGGAIWSGAFSHDGKTCMTGNAEGEVVAWDVATWKVRMATPLGDKWPVRELAVAPDGSAFVAETKAALELWSLKDGKYQKVGSVGERLNFGEGLAFSPAGDQIATGGMFDIVLHDAKTGAKTKSLRHASYTMGLAFSPDGKQIASAPRGNVNKFLAVFDIAKGTPIFNAGPFNQYILHQAFTPDGKRVVAVGMDKNIRLFDVATGEVVLTINRTENGGRTAVSRDGRLLGWSEPNGYRYIDLGAIGTNGK